jgi:hypothetical protein
MPNAFKGFDEVNLNRMTLHYFWMKCLGTKCSVDKLSFNKRTVEWNACQSNNFLKAKFRQNAL